MDDQLKEQFSQLTDCQLEWVKIIVAQFGRPHLFKQLEDSDIISTCALESFGDALQIHHCFSKEAFSKDKFEYVLEQVLCESGVDAVLAPRGNPGHDITIEGQPVSLKTQANKTIRADQIWISKFMELGRGDWTDQESQLEGLRDRFFRHMESYDRIISLRRLLAREDNWHYELVEIPKELLLEAASGRLEMMHDSKQNPKPGYCYVTTESGENKYQLYFDGGTERKLQIKALEKRFCVVHAEWRFVTA